MPKVRIGLVRHFEVLRAMPRGWLRASDLTQWRVEYEAAQVIAKAVDIGSIPWRRCISSNIVRAHTTARHIYPGTIEQMPELREPEIAEFRTGNLKLPFPVWRWILRFAWMASHRSQAAAKLEFINRVRHVSNRVLIPAREDTLIVSHAGMMMYLRKELVRLGYRGPTFQVAENGKLYVFEKTF